MTLRSSSPRALRRRERLATLSRPHRRCLLIAPSLEVPTATHLRACDAAVPATQLQHHHPLDKMPPTRVHDSTACRGALPDLTARGLASGRAAARGWGGHGCRGQGGWGVCRAAVARARTGCTRPTRWWEACGAVVGWPIVAACYGSRRRQLAGHTHAGSHWWLAVARPVLVAGSPCTRSRRRPLPCPCLHASASHPTCMWPPPRPESSQWRRPTILWKPPPPPSTHRHTSGAPCARTRTHHDDYCHYVSGATQPGCWGVLGGHHACPLGVLSPPLLRGPHPSPAAVTVRPSPAPPLSHSVSPLPILPRPAPNHHHPATPPLPHHQPAIPSPHTHTPRRAPPPPPPPPAGLD